MNILKKLWPLINIANVGETTALISTPQNMTVWPIRVGDMEAEIDNGEPVTVDEWFQTQSVNPLILLDDNEKQTAIKMMTKRLSNQRCIEVISPE